MTKDELIAQFNPNDPAEYDSVFGLPFEEQHASLVILPVPWQATVSYREGTAKGPSAIRTASQQVDLYDPVVDDAWKIGHWMAPEDQQIADLNASTRLKVLQFLDDHDTSLLEEINQDCTALTNWVRSQCNGYLDNGKKVVLLGGDHSSPLGYIQALAQRHENFGILQFDAHADLRDAYEGFEYSHASIMYNALKIPQVNKLIQVGIRDYCEEEADLIDKGAGLIKTFFDRDLKHGSYQGETWGDQVERIIAHLPPKVYLSVDIDALDPKLCPNTGTPVPGGMDFDQMVYLVERVVETGHELIGMDLCEVAPGNDEWDANVGARILWRLSNLLGRTETN